MWSRLGGLKKPPLKNNIGGGFAVCQMAHMIMIDIGKNKFKEKVKGQVKWNYNTTGISLLFMELNGQTFES